jgi:translation initiation factor IF-2
MRIYQLAKTLNVESKDLLDYCKELGYDIKNQLSSLDHDQTEALTQRVKQGNKVVAAAAAPVAPVIPTVTSSRVQTIPRVAKPAAARPAPEVPEPAPAAPSIPTPTAAPAVPPPAAVAPPAAPTPADPRPTAPPTRPPTPAAPPTVAAQGPVPTPPRTGHPGITPPGGRAPLTGAPRTPPAGGRPPAAGPTPGGGPRPGGDGGSAPRVRTPLLPRGRGAGYSVVTRSPTASPPPSLRKPDAAGPKPRPTPGGVTKIANITEELLKSGRPITVGDVLKSQRTPPGGTPEAPPPSGTEEEDEEGKGKVRPGKVTGRDQRRIQRDQRAKERKGPGVGGVAVVGGVVTEVEMDRPSRYRLKHRAKQRQKATEERKSEIVLTTPITVRSLSEGIGLGANRVISKLVELGLPLGSFNINSVIETDMAELVAADASVQIKIRKQQDAEQVLVESLKEPDDPTKLQPRAPVVTIMGHVDHGKTSLLDKIRKSNVVDTEAGGITQVIRAWRVEYDGKPITFLDTPGHEAFTKMRARGAQVTDIAVIVVAATDGVMPQTEEAINHAKAAEVEIVVAINKVDMPNANVNRTRQQLYAQGLLPDNMGGDVPFVETSAATGQGIDELLEAILLVAELKELKANPDKPAGGTCLEAHLRGDEGVFATLLVREGTLRKGDIVICGATFGRVRAMYNDLGRSINEAGPSVPVRITGLDDVPDADDPFQVVEELTQAREIAEKRRARKHEEMQAPLSTRTLDSLGQIKVSELKVILKADFRGSVEAIRKELEKLRHEEVRARLLHTGIGAITVSDVQLALTSPQDTIIVGFNTTPDDDALRLAEEKGIQIREYNIIYNLTKDIKAALEGRLKPLEEDIHLGRAVVRETFKISRVGTVAGCYVTKGTIARSAKVRVIRGGVVIYPPAGRTAGLDSLKRFKEDVREVNEGFECGLKIAGYDDIKVDDVIEAYRVEQVQRTL